MATKQQGEKQVQAAKRPDQNAAYILDELRKGDVSESKAAAYFREGLYHYRQAGKVLARVRTECSRPGHPYYRKWLPWLKEHGIIQQRASECIRLHESWDKLPRGGSFGLKEALHIISGGGTPDTIPDTTPDMGEKIEAKSGPGKPAGKSVRAEPAELGYSDDGSRQLPLVPVSKDDYAEFKEKIKVLAKAWHSRNDTEAVMQAVRLAHKGVTK